ncbi:I-KAPPA-B-LIKE PROTEIN (IKBL) [Ceraceosorus bombacis]|uniref:I-KAPPA-B-LIKE PROTEIN (IKBL) n=1 Tax=Ceraceosorus bombacis TaxID=401625 RepID=A0A0P1BDT9_9BASI|nr:I-KAPPA-B-LIKE PROTEIN (IKBL) [Ceraceosorus bombacis]
MDDEEYAEYIRDGMWRRAHAADIAAQEAAAEKAKKRKAEQDAAKAARVQERIEAASKRQGVELDEARIRWEKAWSDLSSSIQKEPDGTLMQDLRYQDIPWPATRELGHSLDLGPDSLRRFLLEITPADRTQAKQLSDEQRSRASMGDAEATPGSEVANARLRTALRRYHPDRFFSHNVFGRVAEVDKERVRKAVEHVAQGLSELVGQRRA